MKITDAKAKEMYDGDVYKCVRAINKMMSTAQGLEFMLLKRLRAWVSQEQARRNRSTTHKKHTVLCAKWISRPDEALEELVKLVNETGFTEATVSGRRIRRKDLTKPFGPNNMLIGV